jgi:glycosyltransferase involved in cell wall biosynthesis
VKTVAVIPALNEAVGLAKVLSEIPANWIDEVIVVAGGSSDAAPKVAVRTMARARDLGLSMDLLAPNTRRVLESINGH